MGRRRAGIQSPTFAAAIGLLAGVLLTGLVVPYVRTQPVETTSASGRGLQAGGTPAAGADFSPGGPGATVPGDGTSSTVAGPAGSSGGGAGGGPG
ncbi:MAG: hypothetical protein ACREI6_11950, partial [Candidatus Rokuibacteriota bacterium]